MTIYSYVSKTVEQGGWSGVCRFDVMLRRAIPELVSITAMRIDITNQDSPSPEFAPLFGSSDVVITDNHLSLDVPEGIKTIVVHHGCAGAHYDRDVSWRSGSSSRMVQLQREMIGRQNLTWIAPSRWVADEFSRRNPGWLRAVHILPHWVDTIEPLPKSGKPVIIGDWRDYNKGSETWWRIAAQCPQWEFQPLKFIDEAGRREQYGKASLYLCLSLSEGGSYAMCDAEAASLPIVTTDVGNHIEFSDCEVIQWQSRDNVNLVIAAIQRKLEMGRLQPSFYKGYNLFDWQQRIWDLLV